MNNRLTNRYNPDAYATHRRLIAIVMSAIGGGLFIGGLMALVYTLEGLFK
jgi:hypothetical protein